MKNELLYPDSVCQIALQHHEHWDGTGYPQRLSGDSINRSALIVSVADAFIAMLNKKSYRDSMTGYQAMKTIVAETASCFSPNVLQAFVKTIGIYPIGSGVLLNDGSIARIISVNDSAPLRPVLQVIAGKNGAIVEKSGAIDLLTNKTLFITRDVDVKSVLRQPAL
jgi:HD-GYP domain-containing protein (c-di-GMP phosphodiesterase class II)